MKTNKLLKKTILLAALMFFFKICYLHTNSDTLVLDEVVLKSALINQN